jgi:hypothetical protein
VKKQKQKNFDALRRTAAQNHNKKTGNRQTRKIFQRLDFRGVFGEFLNRLERKKQEMKHVKS